MSSTSGNSLIVLHSARTSNRTYVFNTAHIVAWANNEFPAGSAVFVVGVESPFLVKETPDEVTRLFTDSDWDAHTLAKYSRVEYGRAPVSA